MKYFRLQLRDKHQGEPEYQINSGADKLHFNCIHSSLSYVRLSKPHLEVRPSQASVLENHASTHYSSTMPV